MAQNKKRLNELSGSDFQMADGEPDIRGWNVSTGKGESLGEVDELIFDENSLKVRYLVLDTSEAEISVDDKKVLIPIGLAELHEKDDEVILQNITAEHVEALPEYDEDDEITVDSESTIRQILSGGVALGAAGLLSDSESDFYAHDHFDEDRLFSRRTAQESNTIPIIEENLSVGKRIVGIGGVRVNTSITEQPVEQTVSLREETVNVQRTPVDRPLGSDSLDSFQEGVIELRETAEIPVISKEARVVEEISIGKDVTEREATIRDTVRNTEVDVERIDRRSDSSL